jgi:hypothetical protein
MTGYVICIPTYSLDYKQSIPLTEPFSEAAFSRCANPAADNDLIRENNICIQTIHKLSQQRTANSDTALGYRMDDRGFESQQRTGIFLFTKVSKPALEPTNPPIQWVPWVLSLGVKRLEREADH